jgi:hypothetical protein
MKRKLLDAAEMARKRWASVTKEQKSELGRKAANARWAKWRKAKKSGPDGPKEGK